MTEDEMVSILRNPKFTGQSRVSVGKDMVDNRTTKWFGIPLVPSIAIFICFPY